MTSSTPRRGTRGTRHGARGEERRRQILDAALEVIAERGYRGASVAAVAERVGLSQQGVLHYFPSKEALLVGVLERRDAWDIPGSSPDDVAGGRTWPLANFQTLVDYNGMRPGVVQTFSALLGESVTDGHPARGYFTRRYVQSRASAAASLRAEFGEHLPGGLTPEQAAPLLIAVMDGLQFQWLLDPESVDMGEAFAALLALLGGGAEQDT